MILRFLPILFALLFILLQRVNIKVIMREELTVKINFNIIAIVFSQTDTAKPSPEDLINLCKNLRGIFTASKYLLSKSVVNIKFFKETTQTDTHSSIFSYVRTMAVKRVILAYLEANSKHFVFSEKALDDERKMEEGKTYFDLVIYFSLIHLINSALILLYYIIKNKAKRVINNV